MVKSKDALSHARQATMKIYSQNVGTYVKNYMHGVPNAKETLAIKKAICNANDSKIRAELNKSEKVQTIVKRE